MKILSEIWSTNKQLAVSSTLLFLVFFIPYLSIFFAFFILPFFVWGLFKLKSLNDGINVKNKYVKFGLIPIALYIGLFVVYSVFAGFYSNSVSPQNNKPVTQEVSNSSNQDSKVAELEQKAKDEEAKRVEAENTKKDLENKIDLATKVNLNYDVESDLEAQSLETTKQANLAIATLGNTTKDQKLFDVISVVDGDTVKVSELGTLRLIGIDTPETKDPRKPVQCFGTEASNKAKELLSGKKVYLEFDPANRIDKYGRTLAYLYREDGYFYNAETIKDGYAHSYTKYPHPKLDEFNSYQTQARETKKGLWSETTCNGDTTKASNSEQKSSTTNVTKSVYTSSSQQTTTSSGIVKKSTTNICHAPGTTYYNQTNNFTPYNTLDECLSSGGRMPLR
jgi:endonuclease YncB( thermonuclease family)